MEWPSKANPFAARIEYRVVGVEEVEAQDPVAHVGRIHEAQLALPRRVLHVRTPRQLISDVVHAERQVVQLGEVFSRAHRRWQSVLQFKEFKLWILLSYDAHECVEVLAWYQRQTRARINYQLVNLYWQLYIAIAHIAHGQRPIVRIEQVVPYYVTLGVGSQIEATDHHSTLFEILAYGKGKQVLVDLTLVVQLLNE